MSGCLKCGISEDTLPYNCKFCSHNFCSNHRLPEAHECEDFKSWNNNKISEKIKKISSPIRKEYEKDKIIIFIIVILFLLAFYLLRM